MNVGILKALLPSALLLAAAPAFAQSARIVSQGAAYAYAEERAATERRIQRALGMPVPGGAAQVVFFRPASLVRGSAAIAENGRSIARLPAHSYVAVAVPPGTHAFAAGGTQLSLRLAPGERRYVRVADGRDGLRLAASQAPRFLRASLAEH